MKVSLNEVKKMVPEAAKIETGELIKLIGARLVEVEGSEDWGEKYRGIMIVKVLSAEAIPETHLHLCQIEVGKKEPVQVVCGAPNVHAGMLAAWIQPGAVVPETYGTSEPFMISARKLRGYESNGMLAAADELALGDDHDGIIEIDPEMKTASGKKVEPGMTMAEAFELNDVILDIENKSLTHRPDCFGLIGFAREVAGILEVPFLEPEVFELVQNATSGKTETKNGLKLLQETGALDVQITDSELCPRYSAAVVELGETPRSKYFTQTDVFLAKAGMRGISPIVDLTNVLMLETGQPMHAFDYDKFKIVGGGKAKIIVRAAKKGEEIELLDGKTIKCDENDILITSNNMPVALAGAMGGKNTEIDATTKKIILESATFSLYHLRKTQMAHGIFSEAITRFTKGQPASLTLPVLTEAVRRLGLKPLEVADCWPKTAATAAIKLTAKRANDLLGTNYSTNKMVETLQNVGFQVETNEQALSVTPPAWRTDIAIPEDVIEEIGRLLGYDNIPLALPTRQFRGANQDPLLKLKTQLRTLLSERLAMHELLTYSFVSSRLQEQVGEDPNDSYEIVNSISPELQRFRQTIVPSLLEKVRDNLKAGFSDFALYEVNQVTKCSYGLNTENVPEMKTHLAVALTGDFYEMKTRLEALMDGLGLVAPEFCKIDEDASDKNGGLKMPAYFEKVRSAVVKVGNQEIGFVGEIRKRTLKALKIDTPVSAMEIDLERLLEAPNAESSALKLSKFPTVSRDLTVRVASGQEFGPVESTIRENLGELIAEVKPVSIYQKDEAAKNLSFHLEFSHPEKTLKTEEISDIMGKIERELERRFEAQII